MSAVADKPLPPPKWWLNLSRDLETKAAATEFWRLTQGNGTCREWTMFLLGWRRAKVDAKLVPV